MLPAVARGSGMFLAGAATLLHTFIHSSVRPTSVCAHLQHVPGIPGGGDPHSLTSPPGTAEEAESKGGCHAWSRAEKQEGSSGTRRASLVWRRQEWENRSPSEEFRDISSTGMWRAGDLAWDKTGGLHRGQVIVGPTDLSTVHYH